MNTQSAAVAAIDRVLPDAAKNGHQFKSSRDRDRQRQTGNRMPKITKAKGWVQRVGPARVRVPVNGEVYSTRCLDPRCGRSVIALPDGRVVGSALGAKCAQDDDRA